MKQCMTWVFAVGVVLALSSLTPSAALAEDEKIGVLDLQRVISESKEGARISAELKEKKSQLQQQLDTLQEELVQMKKDLEKQGLMLSMDAKEDKEKEYERKRRELAYTYEDIREEMREAESEAMRSVVKDLEKVVAEFAEKNGYLMILERRRGGIITYDDAIDVTDQIIKAYDQTKQ